jgi:hypothetical protein
MHRTRSHRVVKGLLGTVDVDQLTVVGLATDVSAALQAPVTSALAAYTKAVTSSSCSGPVCNDGDFQADFATSRVDANYVSGTWTILTMYPGAAHPSTQLISVTVNGAEGTVVAPSALFVGNSLTALAATVRPFAKAKLDAIGCSTGGDDELAQGTAPTADNYVATAVSARGLFVGMSDDQIAAHACGLFELFVPWSAVQKDLSAVGQRIAAPVSAPVAPVASATVNTSESAARCTTTALNVSFGTPTAAATSQYRLPIIFTNVSTAPCSLLGFPGADLSLAGALPLSLVRAAGKPARVELPPGASATAVLTYLVGPDPACDTGGAWTPTTATITPPDETTSVQIPWPGMAVDDCQSGATHPGSYIGMVTARKS